MDFVIVAVLVLLSGAFSGLTLGFFSLNLTSLERKMKLGNKMAKKDRFRPLSLDDCGRRS